MRSCARVCACAYLIACVCVRVYVSATTRNFHYYTNSQHFHSRYLVQVLSGGVGGNVVISHILEKTKKEVEGGGDEKEEKGGMGGG